MADIGSLCHHIRSSVSPSSASPDASQMGSPEEVSMGASPLVSIIVVNWNGERFLDECLSSLTNQTWQRREILLVDTLRRFQIDVRDLTLRD